MAMVMLEGVHRVKTRYKGKETVYIYAWRGKGAPRIKSPEGTAAFNRELELAWQKRRGGDEGKIAGLVVEWLKTDPWAREAADGGMSDSTKANWRPWTDHIRRDLGKLMLKQFERPESRQVIKKWRDKWKDTPRTADMGKQVLSALLSYAVEEGRLGSNPCIGLSNLYSADRSDIIWTDADLAKFAETASPEIMFALRLAALTGLRQSDLLRLEPAHVGDLAIELPSDKSRGKLTYTVPMYGELRALLAEIDAYWDRRRAEIVAEAEANGKPAPLLPRTSILFTSDLKPWSSGFGSSWNKACWAALPAEARDAELARSAAAKKAIAEREKAGKAVTDEERKAASPDITAAGWKLHFHDARGTAATKFYLARDAKGERIFSIEEIAEILAWSVKRVENIIKRYVTKDALLREKIRRMDGGDG